MYRSHSQEKIGPTTESARQSVQVFTRQTIVSLLPSLECFKGVLIGQPMRAFAKRKNNIKGMKKEKTKKLKLDRKLGKPI